LLCPLCALRCLSFFLSRSGAHRDLHSFPTRRSSDLALGLKRGFGDAEQHRLRFGGFSAHLLDALVLVIELDLVDLFAPEEVGVADRKSTRLNSSHDQISYAVFCLKKKNKKNQSSIFI